MKSKRPIARTRADKRTAGSQQRVVSQRRPCNINDHDAALEAMNELRDAARVRMHFNDYSTETWAMLMGAKALDRLAG